MIPFNVPPFVGNEVKYIEDAIKRNKISGDGYYTKKCSQWLEEYTGCPKVLLTTSCTHALEMAAILCNIQQGDEVIMSSFTFVSTANAFVLRGAKIVFVDIRPDTMNIDESLIEQAITNKTKVIVAVHYAGVACEMDTIMAIARRHNILVVEDAAQGIMSKYKGKPLGTIGDFGCYSFHETKNLSMGEGGALLINDVKYIEDAEIIREKGTNRSKFFRGEIDKYTWTAIGSSYLPSELNAAYLFAQLEMAEKIYKDRMSSWQTYYRELIILKERGVLSLPVIPKECIHNAHIFYIKVKNREVRDRFINFMKKKQVNCTFHYIPLHNSIAGAIFGVFNGIDRYSTKESDSLIRLPLYYKLATEECRFVVNSIYSFVNV